MKNDSKEAIEEFNEFSKQFAIAISSNEFIFSFFGISFASVMVFGLSFFLITLGLIGCLWLMATVFDPAYQIFRKLFRLNNLPSHLIKPPTSRAIFIWVMLILPGSLVIFGVKGLLGGFGPLNFSLIYELIRFFLR